jgi:hypothetical protein
VLLGPARDALDQLGRLLDHPAGGIASEVAHLEHAQGVRAEIDHIHGPCSDPATGKPVPWRAFPPTAHLDLG